MAAVETVVNSGVPTMHSVILTVAAKVAEHATLVLPTISSVIA